MYQKFISADFLSYIDLTMEQLDNQAVSKRYKKCIQMHVYKEV